MNDNKIKEVFKKNSKKALHFIKYLAKIDGTVYNGMARIKIFI